GEIPDLPETTDPVLKSVFERLMTPEGSYSAGIENREDFAEMSQPVRLEAPEVEKTADVSHSSSMTKEETMRATRMTNQIDPLYDYINNIDGYRDLNANSVQTEFARYDHLEESERKIYTYLYRSQGKESAEAYLNTLANRLTDRMAAANAEVIRQNIEDMPWLAPLYAVGSVPTNLIGGVVGAVDMLWQTVRNGEVDINSDAQRFARYGRTVRSIATEDMGAVGKFFTDTVLSAAESGLAALLPGGTIALAASAGTATAQETIQRGGSAWQALAAGGAAAIFEGLFEKLSISNLEALQQVKPETVKQVIGELGKTVLVNFEEELATEAANIAFDALFLGDASAWDQSMEAYRQQGKTEAEAFWATMKDNAIQTALAGVSGAVMGGMFGAASTPGMYTRSHITRESVENRDTAQEITESGQYPFDHTGKRTVKEIPTVAQTVNLSSEDLGKPRAAIFDNSIVREDSFVPKPATGLPTDLTAKVEAQRAAGGGVVSDGIPAWMTSREKRALNAVAQSQQLVVRFASEGELSGGTLGYLDGDTIVLNPESKQPVLDTYIHEVTHALKQTAPESYRQYQQGILDILGDETLNSRTQIAVEKLRERYEATSGEVSESQLNDELTAEFTSWVLQTNVQTLENIAGLHRNVFQRVYDALSEVWQRIKLGASDGEASASLKNVLGLDLDDVDVE
ncbi:MAG: hypothetical protein IJ042_02755, partial [Butyricicoccus sp.]|nr:hypothetical protein [Butyricicoccus sp.]